MDEQINNPAEPTEEEATPEAEPTAEEVADVGEAETPAE